MPGVGALSRRLTVDIDIQIDIPCDPDSFKRLSPDYQIYVNCNLSNRQLIEIFREFENSKALINVFKHLKTIIIHLIPPIIGDNAKKIRL